MNVSYADAKNVVEAMRNHTEASDEEKGRITVLDAPGITIRGCDAEELEERNVWSVVDRYDDQICTLKWEKNHFGGYQWELHFHESQLGDDAEFTLKPAGKGAINPSQATEPRHLSRGMHTAMSRLVSELDADFQFTKVDAASIASGGYPTDFEFTYDVFVNRL